MKITLYLEDKILEFLLPAQISGSYCFDEDPQEESKLINIEARNGAWVLYGTEDVSLVSNTIMLQEIALQENTFYVLRRREKNYLIYVSPIWENNFITFSYDANINLLIGNQKEYSVFYDCPYLKDSSINIKNKEGHLFLETKGNTNIYIDKMRLQSPGYYIKGGEQIHIFGLKMIFLPTLLLINNPQDRVKVNENQSGGVHSYLFPVGDPLENLEVKEVDLYDKDAYFSKSPRIRRIIEGKTIKLDPPPKSNDNEDMPLILTIGPMLTMGVMSMTTIANTIYRLHIKETTMDQSWPQLVTGGAMLATMLFWPLIIRFYNKRQKKRKKKELIEKYDAYLQEKRKELSEEAKLQKDILIENLITIEECINIIRTKGNNFWDKRIDQSDFLTTRIGVGDELLKVKVEYPEEGFTIEESDLRKKADNLVEEFKYIKNVPVSYSFYENKTTAIMGRKKKRFLFINNIILQLITFYSYEDLKIVVFTNEEDEKELEYLKYLPHSFKDDNSIRFFASTTEESKQIAEYLNFVVTNRLERAEQNQPILEKPHYLVLVDDYDKIKKQEFVKIITEVDNNLGFSLVIMEERLSKLPSKCNNFISLGENKSGVLKNSYEKQEQITFIDEANQEINMMAIAKILANIPIEFEQGSHHLPNAINFMEMENVGKVEQLNVLNRWNTNDSTSSLKAEVGVDEEGDLMYLDLHEKYHGPHGLIAGMTGSGKSEFIITYILSMAINYSPDDVSFILIDYKGGGLAFAFENKSTGSYLPHLAGTITNLDKAEMDRTLVSIDSEVKRRQQLFNEARDSLGESTIDIYKYQKFYKEGKLKEAIPHLFIVCDEFAELKSQQPDFMDNLISVARIGRSLGVHLILATQKPSGVVNEQIWSNSKFRVCLKVQDEQDSKEMLKRPDAASLKQTGRFYLQVGYDEYFALGQSAWCGAKYYPSDKIVKKIDKSVNVIDNTGEIIKSIQEGTNIKIEPQGEQLSAIMKTIIETAKLTGKTAKRLWLENISDMILINYLEQKYNYTITEDKYEAILGEYDAPERQEQGLVKYNYLEEGNTIIYGTDGSERENLLQTLIYSTVKYYSPAEINYYLVDYGSETLRRFQKFPQIGGIVFAQEEEKFHNLMKLLKEKQKERKKLFADFGGEFQNYKKTTGQTLPIITVIINNYDSVYESHEELYDEFPELVRDSERYGMVFILTGNSINSVHSKIAQNFHNIYAFHLKDPSDYLSVFNTRTKVNLRDIKNRGLLKIGDVHEFQTASIIAEEEKINEHLEELLGIIKKNTHIIAPPIPTLPDQVKLEHVEKKITNLAEVPIGITKNDLEIETIDFTANLGYVITSNKLAHMLPFTKSLITVLQKIVGKNIIIFDANKNLTFLKGEFPNFYQDNLEECFDKVKEYFNTLNEKKQNQTQIVFLMVGFAKMISKFSDMKKIGELVNTLKKYEKANIILIDEASKLKPYTFESWYTTIINNNEGIWIGRGLPDQNILKLSNVTKEMTKDYKYNMGFHIAEGVATLCKLINFSEEEDIDEE